MAWRTFLSARADSIALLRRLSNSRRLMRPVSASCAAWYESRRFMRRSRLTSLNTMTAPAVVPGAVADRRDRRLDRHLEAAAAHQHGLVGEVDRVAARERVAHRVLDRLVAAVLHELDDLGDVPAAGLVRGPAGHLLGDRVDVVDRARAVGRDHGVGDGLQRDLRPLLFLVELLLRALALGDVGHRALEPDRLAALVAVEARILGDRDDGAVAALQLVLGLHQLAVGLQLLDQLAAQGRVHVQAVGRADRAQLLERGIAQHRDQRRVRGQQVAVERHLVDALDDVVEQAAEAALALAQRIVGAAPLDRDARELGHATHQLEVAARGHARALQVGRERAEHAPVGAGDRRRPAGVQAGLARPRRGDAPRARPWRCRAR